MCDFCENGLEIDLEKDGDVISMFINGRNELVISIYPPMHSNAYPYQKCFRHKIKYCPECGEKLE